MLIYVLVAPGPATGTPRAYVGSTEHPRARLLAHARRPVAKMAKWLADHHLTIDDVRYSPLECVPLRGRDDAETQWSLRLKTHDGKGFNAFGAYGNPTRQKRFWQRRHVKTHAAQQLSVNDGAHVPPACCSSDCGTIHVESQAGTRVAPESVDPIDLRDSGDEHTFMVVSKPSPVRQVPITVAGDIPQT